jgi:uncharacterized protein
VTVKDYIPEAELPRWRLHDIFPEMKRRSFLKILGGVAAGSMIPLPGRAAEPDRLGRILPTRMLGNRAVTVLGLGGYHIGWTSAKEARETIEAALEEGVRFFDTAESYGPHVSEERFGEWLTPVARDEIYLMTKSQAMTGNAAQEAIEGSLRRLRTDHIDLWQMHALSSPEDVDNRLDGGVLEAALEAREKGRIGAIGFTGHASPYVFLRIMERTGGDPSPFAACQFPINPVDAAAKHSFTREVIPAAEKNRIAILAMKTLADGRFFARKQMGEREVWNTESPIVPDLITLKDCFAFALSLPVTVLITGAEKPEFLRDKAAIVRDLQTMSAQERTDLAERVARFAESGSIEYYKAPDLRTGQTV